MRYLIVLSPALIHLFPISIVIHLCLSLSSLKMHINSNGIKGATSLKYKKKNGERAEEGEGGREQERDAKMI